MIANQFDVCAAIGQCLSLTGLNHQLEVKFCLSTLQKPDINLGSGPVTVMLSF